MSGQDRLKVIVLTHGGSELFLERVLAIPSVDILAVYVENPRPLRRSLVQRLKRSYDYDGALATASKLFGLISGKQRAGGSDLREEREERTELIRFCGEKGVRTVVVDDFHAPESIKLLTDESADLGVLFGTNIIKKSVFLIPRLGSINIHQGLAPYYRGGPTVFWELFNDEKEVGITVHFVAPKVDTGEIILQTTVPMEYDHERYGLDYESFIDDFRASMREPAADLTAKAVELISLGKEERRIQDISLGTRYRLPLKAMKDELRNRIAKRASR
ncbi:MAG: formyltransferase family protein [Pyrinomonadaceae bacterium]